MPLDDQKSKHKERKMADPAQQFRIIRKMRAASLREI
jgi:hypothetical protein